MDAPLQSTVHPPHADNPVAPAYPTATARLQFHKGFTFDDARTRVPYYSALGISHLYASPILTARSGSTHGYDVVDPSSVNPELGGEDGLRLLVASLRSHGMGLILDIVPNHMAVGFADNRWWLDVLEWGPESRYATFFDIDWDVPDPALSKRVLVPFLTRPYGEALLAGELQLCFDMQAGRFYARHFEHRFPICPRRYASLLKAGGDRVAALVPAFRDILTTKSTGAARKDAFDAACRMLARTAHAENLSTQLEDLLTQFTPTTSAGRQNLHELLERQHYRLAWWRTTADEINWRRFFDVTELAALRVQERAVFEAVHATVFRLYAEGLIDGLRIDHIDGLADPRGYCRQLRARLDKLRGQRQPPAPMHGAYLVVEKILAPQEKLDQDWRIDGTSGYVFMSQVGALLHDSSGEQPLRAFWKSSSGLATSFHDNELQARRRISQELFAADFSSCARALHVIARSNPATRDWTLAAIRRVLTEFLVHFPVYRTYADARGRNAEDEAIMQKVVSDVQKCCAPGERELAMCLNQWLGGEPPQRVPGAAARRARLRALARFQQLTSPVAAKAVEDTAFYRYGALLSRNDVGADPNQFSLGIDEFHQACIERQSRYPRAMLATATHDHKRGEDLRARLAVLSEVADRWTAQTANWYALNSHLKSMVESRTAPETTDEYMLYQMLVGAWPLDLKPDDNAGLADLRGRIEVWQQKAVREAKLRSGWIDPNLPYEKACRGFLQKLLDPVTSPQFLAEIHSLVGNIAAAGAINGLTQTLLRMTTPGVPDLYQGCDFWDFSLVDPDNRRPVNFNQRAAALQRTAPDSELLERWKSGWIKQRLIQRTLSLRRRNEGLFAAGRYIPLVVRGLRAGHIVAFAREHDGEAIIVVVPRLSYALLSQNTAPTLSPKALGDTAVVIPPRLSRHCWIDILSATEIGILRSPLSVATALRAWPVACLYAGRSVH